MAFSNGIIILITFRPWAHKVPLAPPHPSINQLFLDSILPLVSEKKMFPRKILGRTYSFGGLKWYTLSRNFRFFQIEAMSVKITANGTELIKLLCNTVEWAPIFQKIYKFSSFVDFRLQNRPKQCSVFPYPSIFFQKF